MVNLNTPFWMIFAEGSSQWTYFVSFALEASTGPFNKDGDI